LSVKNLSGTILGLLVVLQHLRKTVEGVNHTHSHRLHAYPYLCAVWGSIYMYAVVRHCVIG